MSLLSVSKKVLRFHASSCSTPPCPLLVSNPFKKPQIKSMKWFNMWLGPLEGKEGIQPHFEQMYKDENVNMFHFK